MVIVQPQSIGNMFPIGHPEKRYVTYTYMREDATITKNTLVKLSTNDSSPFSIVDFLPLESKTIYSNCLINSDDISWKNESTAILNNVWCIRHMPTGTLLTSPLTAYVINRENNMSHAKNLNGVSFPLFSKDKHILEIYLKMRLEVSNLSPVYGNIIRELSDKKELEALKLSENLGNSFGSTIHPETNWRVSLDSLVHRTLKTVSNISEYEIVYMSNHTICLSTACYSIDSMNQAILTEKTISRFYNEFKPCIKLFRKYNYNVNTNKYVTVKV